MILLCLPMHPQYGETFEIRSTLDKHSIIDFLMNDKMVMSSKNEIDALH